MEGAPGGWRRRARNGAGRGSPPPRPRLLWVDGGRGTRAGAPRRSAQGEGGRTDPFGSTAPPRAVGGRSTAAALPHWKGKVRPGLKPVRKTPPVGRGGATVRNSAGTPVSGLSIRPRCVKPVRVASSVDRKNLHFLAGDDSCRAQAVSGARRRRALARRTELGGPGGASKGVHKHLQASHPRCFPFLSLPSPANPVACVARDSCRAQK